MSLERKNIKEKNHEKSITHGVTARDGFLFSRVCFRKRDMKFTVIERRASLFNRRRIDYIFYEDPHIEKWHVFKTAYGLI